MDTKPEPLLRARGVRKIYHTGAVSVVALASLVARPAIVWADEPTGNLDTKLAASVMGGLRQCFYVVFLSNLRILVQCSKRRMIAWEGADFARVTSETAGLAFRRFPISDCQMQSITSFGGDLWIQAD